MQKFGGSCHKPGHRDLEPAQFTSIIYLIYYDFKYDLSKGRLRSRRWSVDLFK